MPKRCRNSNVTFVDGKIQISASGIIHIFDGIDGWNMCETTCRIDKPQYAVNIFSTSGGHLVPCVDDNEMLSIADELIFQRIGKRI
jgi:hypothetical protein